MATKSMEFTSKGIIGEILVEMDNVIGASWVGQTSLYVPSNEEVESYAWFGGLPAMTELGSGGEVAHRPKQFTWQVTNKEYRASIDIPLTWIRRDKTGQIQQKIRELAMTSENHWSKLLSDLIVAGEAATCYDGQYFFDTDHDESGSNQSNDIQTDISAVTANLHGTTTVPSPEEMKAAIFKSIRTFYGLTDDKGNYINQNARSFVMAMPLGLWEAAAEAFEGSFTGNGTANVLNNLTVDGRGLALSLTVNPYLSWTDRFATFVGDGQALIRQEEVEPTPKAKAEGSDYEFDNNAWQFALDSTRAAAYGRWQHAVLNTLV